MTSNNENPTALTNGDIQRAAAMIGAYGRDDWEGLASVLREVNDQSNPTRTLLALLSLYNQIIPELRTPMAQQCLTQFIIRTAGQQS